MNETLLGGEQYWISFFDANGSHAIRASIVYFGESTVCLRDLDSGQTVAVYPDNITNIKKMEEN